MDVPVRWMAITYIKNGVDRYWRAGAPMYVQILFAGKPWVYVCGVITTALSVKMKRPLCEEPFWIVWKNLSSR